MDLVKRMEEYRERARTLVWEGTFAQYFEIASRQPSVAQLSHERIYSMIMAAGTETGLQGEIEHKFFEDEIFGLEQPLAANCRIFPLRRAAARGAQAHPPADGPGRRRQVDASSRCSRSGLEAHTRTDAGAVYAINGCPMHEEPLHLIPPELRRRHREGIRPLHRGRALPECRWQLEHKYGGKHRSPCRWSSGWSFSEKNRLGIGTFTPSDPKTQDISELVGGIDLATIGEVGAECDPRAYRFDGELNIANRGMMEFIEMLKADEKFLYVLLTLSQEQNIKTGRFSMIYADEVVVCHTNEHEYTSFVGNRSARRCRTASSWSRCRTTCASATR